MLWDRRTGLPVHRAIVWQCRRSAPICERLRAAGLEPLVRARTGLVLDAYFSGTKIAWLLESRPELRASAARGELAFGTVDSWLLWQLTGGRVHATDPSNASRTLCFDIRRLDWDPELTGHLGIPREVFPRVSPSAGVFGETVAHDGLPAGIPVAGIAGDQQAALFGQGAVAPGGAKNTYGTGCFLLLNTGPAPVASTAGLLSTVAWSLPPAGGGPPGRVLRARGRRVRRGRRGPVAPGRARPDRDGGGDRGPGALGAGHRGRLPGARLRGPGRALLGHVRAGRSGGAHPRDHARPRRPGDARGDRLPDPGRARRDGCRGGGAPRGAAGRRGRDRERFPLPVPGRRAGAAHPATEGPRDDGARRRLPGGARRGSLARARGARGASGSSTARSSRPCPPSAARRSTPGGAAPSAAPGTGPARGHDPARGPLRGFPPAAAMLRSGDARPTEQRRRGRRGRSRRDQ